MTTLRCCAILTLASLTACTGFSRRELEEKDREGFQVNKSWANAARSVVSPDTPRGEDEEEYEGGPVEADHGPTDDRDRSKLTSLDEDDAEDLGDVVVDLEAGVWTIDDTVRLRGARSVIIRGKGPSRTRLELDNEELKTLQLIRAKRIVIQDLTVVAISGGGLWIKDCPDVQVKNAHFAAARYGLHLANSTATISSSVFVGCQTGVRARDKSSVKLRGTAFVDCWGGIKTTDSGIDVEACAFVEGRTVIRGSLDRRSRVVGCLLFGSKQKLGWTGRPALASHNLTHFRSLKVKLGTETNRELRSLDDFPRAARLPKDLDVVAVHLSLVRQKKRGKKDYDQLLKDVCREEAQSFAEASQKAVQASDLPSARFLARIALRYWGDRPISEAPEELIQIAELAK